LAGDLRNLIRLNEWRVDEKRLELGGFLRVLEDLEAMLKNLEKILKVEQVKAAEDPNEAGFLYGGYAQSVVEKRERIQQHIVKAEQDIATAREELGEAYLELKKFEIAQEEKDRREAEDQNRKEQANADEMSLQTFMHHRR